MLSHFLLLLYQASQPDNSAIHITLTTGVLASIGGQLWQIFGPKRSEPNDRVIQAIDRLTEKIDELVTEMAREAGRNEGRAQAARGSR